MHFIKKKKKAAQNYFYYYFFVKKKCKHVLITLKEICQLFFFSLWIDNSG